MAVGAVLAFVFSAFEINGDFHFGSNTFSIWWNAIQFDIFPTIVAVIAGMLFVYFLREDKPYKKKTPAIAATGPSAPQRTGTSAVKNTSVSAGSAVSAVSESAAPAPASPVFAAADRTTNNVPAAASEPLITQEEKSRLIGRYHNALSSRWMDIFVKRIDTITSEGYARLMSIPLKKKVVAILLAIFFGALGVDRFYVNDVKLGIFKIVGTVGSSLLLFVPIPGTIASIENLIWKIADIFISYKQVYNINYERVMAVIGKA